MYEFLIAVIASGAMAAIAFGLSGFLPERVRTQAGTLAMGLSSCAGLIGVLGWPAVPPANATQWIVYGALIFAIAGALVANKTAVQKPSVLAFDIAVLGLFAALVLRPLIVNTWAWWEAALVLCILPALTVTVKTSYLFLLHQGRRWSVLIVFVTMLAGVAVMLFGGSLKLALSAAAVVSAFAGCVLVSVLKTERFPIHAAFGVAITMTGVVWMEGLVFADVPVRSLVLLLAASLTPWLLAMKRPSSRMLRTGSVSILTGALLLLAIMFAYQNYTEHGPPAYQVLLDDEAFFLEFFREIGF